MALWVRQFLPAVLAVQEEEDVGASWVPRCFGAGAGDEVLACLFRHAVLQCPNETRRVLETISGIDMDASQFSRPWLPTLPEVCETPYSSKYHQVLPSTIWARVVFRERRAVILAMTPSVWPQRDHYRTLGLRPVGRRLMRHRDVHWGTLSVECFEDVGSPFLDSTGATLTHAMTDAALNPRLVVRALASVARFLREAQRDRCWMWRHGCMDTDHVLAFRDGSLVVTQWAPEGMCPWSASPNADMYHFAHSVRSMATRAVWQSPLVQAVVDSVRRSSFVGRRWVTPFGRKFGMPFEDSKVPTDLDALRPHDTVMATVERAATKALYGTRVRVLGWRRASRLAELACRRAGPPGDGLGNHLPEHGDEDAGEQESEGKVEGRALRGRHDGV